MVKSRNANRTAIKAFTPASGKSFKIAGAKKQKMKKAIVARPRVSQERPRNAIRISPCIRLLNEVRAKPFLSRKDLPCLPDLKTFPSVRYSTLTVGQAKIDANGTAFVYLNPYLWNTTPSLFTGRAVATGGAGTAVPGDSFADPDWDPVGFNMHGMTPPYIASNNFQQRMVCCALQVMYNGTVMSTSGRVFTGVGANGGAGNTSQQNPQMLKNLPSTDVEAITPGKTKTLFFVNPGLIMRTTGAGTEDYGSVNSGQTNAGPALFAYYEGAAAGDTIEFKAICYYEALTDSYAPTFKSDSDPVGLAALRATNDKGDAAPEASGLRMIADALIDGASSVFPVFGAFKGAAKAATSLLL